MEFDAGRCLVTRPAVLELARTGLSPLTGPRCREENSAQAYLALAPWVLSSPLSHQSFAAGRGSSLDASTRDSWAFPSHRVVPKKVCSAVQYNVARYIRPHPSFSSSATQWRTLFSVRQECLLRAIPSFFRAKNGPCFFSDCPAAKPSALVPELPKTLLRGLILHPYITSPSPPSRLLSPFKFTGGIA